jgi:hypothetical protein
MVSTPRDLEEVVLGEAGLLSTKRPAASSGMDIQPQ